MQREKLQSLVQFTSANYYAIRGGFYCGVFLFALGFFS